MISKNYKLQIILRVLLIVATGIVLSWMITNTELIASIIMVTVILILLTISLIKYVDKVNLNFIQFISTIKNQDFTFQYSSRKLGRSYELLFDELNDAITKLKEQNINNEAERLFLHSMLTNASAGVLAFNQNGDIEFLNTKARRIFGINPISHIDELDKTDPSILRTCKNLSPGSLTIVEFNKDHDARKVSLISSQLLVRGNQIKTIIVQDVTDELNQSELSAWQKLIRVISHEIINSVTPIASLASSCKGYIEKLNNNGHGQLSEKEYSNLRNAIFTIERRSRGLQKFVSSYRKLNQIPRPEFENVKVTELFTRIKDLFIGQHGFGQNIRFSCRVDPDNLEITADPDLMEQVLLNLLLNSKEAIGEKEGGEIILSASLHESGNVKLSVIDNGKGIEGKFIESIFTPFFTTKKEGSGLGLSISKQIINLHGAKLELSSKPGSGTAFNIRF